MLRQALGLWRGPALVEVAHAPAARAEAARLEEARLDAVEDRIEADLAVGNYRLVTGELERSPAPTLSGSECGPCGCWPSTARDATPRRCGPTRTCGTTWSTSWP